MIKFAKVYLFNRLCSVSTQMNYAMGYLYKASPTGQSIMAYKI